MQSPIRKGDRLEHDGEVTGGSPWAEFMGSPLARKGDEATCDLHGQTVIDEGADKFPDRDHKRLHGAAAMKPLKRYGMNGLVILNS
ncbi:PAAR domain-containing protein [Burkholderia sp. BKH01]|uniref:PAAR domain-containing protein n=1 Tax=Burkholderia sp. BKH01 TaxID=2769262 RepID=UPI0021DFB503|nr:PAAR domain-containing protein [Burkholderia sp. BKH01]MCU9956987.1 PAAR domain-containing protein [Burkholderia sp. BKH01]